ncbi:MAG: hypothetical protein PUG00_07530 [Clostridiales bacterium]|nr:hypothetical protein [Clostridiales bacterium]
MKKIKEKQHVEYIGVHIHNLLNHDYDKLLNFINKIDLPIILWLHDYTSVCPESPILLKNKKNCCKNFGRNSNICKGCCYEARALVSQHAIKEFYSNIDKKIERIIAPSESVMRNIVVSYPNWKNRIYIRGHLILGHKGKINSMGTPLRIAYVGGKFEHKGISEWNTLIEEFSDSPYYRFYYLGASNMNTSNITDVFVDASIQGDTAMSDAALKNKIDVAFLWSKCQETYSYTYYEMRSIGAKILTYFDSGNIAQCVKRENSGLIFDNIQDLVDLMKNPENFRKSIEKCGNEYWMNYRPNDEIDLLIPHNSSDCNLLCDTEQSYIHRYCVLSVIHQGCNWVKEHRERRRLDANKNGKTY